MAASFDEPYQTDPRQDGYSAAVHYDAVLTTPGCLADTPRTIQDQDPPPTEVLGEVPGYSNLSVEYFREHQGNYEFFPENLTGVFLEDHLVDSPSRYFNQYPPPTNTWDMYYTTNYAVVESSVGPSPLAPAGPQASPSAPPSTSTPNSLPEKLYNCTYCRALFDRHSRARDCRNMDLGLTPHQCLGKCGTVGCPVAYGSEALLLEHIKPRAVQCPSCPRTLSKKNMARHQKKYCPGRNLPAGPSTTGVEN